MDLKFLGWNKSFLELCIDELFSTYCSKSLLDLSDYILVSSSSRFNRNLKEELLRSCEAKKIKLSINKVITLGKLPHIIKALPSNIATKDEERFAWINAIYKSNEDLKSKYIGKNLSFSKILSISDDFNSLKDELGRNFHDFSSISIARDEEISEAEIERLDFFNSVYLEYLEELKRRGLICKDFWFKSAIKDSYFSSNKNIILFNCIDITPRLCEILKSSSGNVKHFLFCSESNKEGFSEQGVINSSFWLDHKLDIKTDSINKVFNQDTQTTSVLNQINTGKNSLSIIYRDNLSANLVSKKLREKGVKHTLALSEDLTNSLVGSLLFTIKEFYSVPNGEKFTNLIKNSLLFNYINDTEINQNGLVKRAQKYQQKFLQDNYSRFLIYLPKELKTYYVNFLELTNNFNDKMSLVNCIRSFKSFFDKIFSLKSTLEINEFKSELNLKAFEVLISALEDMEALSDIYGESELNFIDFLSLIISKLNIANYYSELSSEEINIVGCLEALLDKTENILLLDCNQGFLPEEASNSWLFSDSFRASFGLANNLSRFAREIYFCAALESSKDSVKYFILKNNSIQGEELFPSKIFYQSSDKILANTVKYLFNNDESFKEKKLETKDNIALFNIKEPKVEASLSELSVTSFKSYITCPYRFYLQHVKKLYPIELELNELKANQFGSIIHNILDIFAKSELKDSKSSSEIFEFLKITVVDYFNQQFGTNALPSLELQQQVIEFRLKNFSKWQSKRRKDGWRIDKSEFNIDSLDIKLEHDHGLTTLKGRLDRIDKNENDGTLALIDYKTSNTSKTPNNIHLKGGEWIDLQLPLYWYILRASGELAPIELAYVCLSAENKSNLYQKANWNEEDLEVAIDSAKLIAQSIYEGVFWPPKESKYEDSIAFMLKEAVY